VRNFVVCNDYLHGIQLFYFVCELFPSCTPIFDLFVMLGALLRLKITDLCCIMDLSVSANRYACIRDSMCVKLILFSFKICFGS